MDSFIFVQCCQHILFAIPHIEYSYKTRILNKCSKGQRFGLVFTTSRFRFGLVLPPEGFGLLLRDEKNSRHPGLCWSVIGFSKSDRLVINWYVEVLPAWPEAIGVRFVYSPNVSRAVFERMMALKVYSRARTRVYGWEWQVQIYLAKMRSALACYVYKGGD